MINPGTWRLPCAPGVQAGGGGHLTVLRDGRLAAGFYACKLPTPPHLCLSGSVGANKADRYCSLLNASRTPMAEEEVEEEQEDSELQNLRSLLDNLQT